MDQSNYTDREKSILLLQLSLIPNTLFIPIGILAILFNILTFVIICVTKTLQTSCFILLASNAISDILLGLGYSCTGSVRVYRYLIGNGELISMWQCCLEVTVIILAQLLSLANSASLVIDRILAVFQPHKYKTWTHWQLTIPLLCLAYCFSFVQLAIHYENSWMGRNITLKTCGIEDTVFPNTYYGLTLFQMIVSLIIIVLNLTLAVGVKMKKKKLAANTNAGTTSTQRQLRSTIREQPAEGKIVKAISFIVIAHIFTHLGGRLAIFLMSIYANEIWQMMANRYGRQVVVVNAALNFFVLFAMSSEFRTATKAFFRRFSPGTSRVGPAEGVQGASAPGTSGRRNIKSVGLNEL